MVITVTSHDFLTTDYSDNFNCALATAVKRIYPNEKIVVSYDHLFIGDKKYKFDNETAFKLLRSYKLKTPLYVGVTLK